MAGASLYHLFTSDHTCMYSFESTDAWWRLVHRKAAVAGVQQLHAHHLKEQSEVQLSVTSILAQAVGALPGEQCHRLPTCTDCCTLRC